MKRGFKQLCALALVTGMAASGCTATQRSGESFDGLSATHAADARELAEVTADQLAARHAPAQTAVALSRTEGAFGDAFEKALRLKGFAIVPPNYGGTSLGVSYRLGALEGSGPALGYAQVAMSDGKIFSVSRMLGDVKPPTYTEPPVKPAPSRELESRPLPEPASLTTSAKAESRPSTPIKATPEKSGESVKRYPVRKTATAAVVARRSGVDVDDFCRWNGVGKLATLPGGTLVYLSEPPAGTIVTGPDVPVPPKAVEVQQAEMKAEKKSIPAVAATPPTKGQISPALTPPAMPVAEVVPVVPAVSPLATETRLPEAELPPISSPSFPWEIQKGVALQKQMEGWATVAGYHLVWESTNDYMMESRAMFHGTYIEAVKNFFAALAANGHALRVTVYEGNKTVVISEH